MRTSTPIQYVIRALAYCLGLLILAFGVVISVNSNLGVSPVSSLPYIVSNLIPVSLGTCVVIIYCFYILLQVVILRREFKLIQLLQIAFSTIFGYFVDFAEKIIGDFTLNSYVGRLGMLGFSIVLIALGLTIYLDSQLVPMPMEGLTECIAKKVGKPFSTLKTIIDCLVVVLGLVLSLVFLGRIIGIREGTVITAVVAGKLVGLMKKRITPIMNKLCFGE